MDMTTSTSVKAVSKVVLQKSSTPISNLKLQKLLYYIQGWSLGLRNVPAFQERIEAWVHGPVVPAAFHEYRKYRWNPITVPTDYVELCSDELCHIEMILNVYGEFSATQLEQFSHDEAPWRTARGDLDPKESSGNLITHDSMKEYFSQKIQ